MVAVSILCKKSPIETIFLFTFSENCFTKWFVNGAISFYSFS
jgi:hypothetical protein